MIEGGADLSTTMPDADHSRQELHFRRIDMRGYRRSDGLFEVEGRVTDLKPRRFVPSMSAREVPAGEPLHDMGVRLVYDEDMRVREVHTYTLNSPYDMCPEGGRILQRMVGVHMTKGWGREVRSRLSGAHSCIHLVELLLPMATTAFQSLAEVRQTRALKLDADGRPVKIDSCYAFRAEGELVRALWPQHQRSAERPPGSDAEESR